MKTVKSILLGLLIITSVSYTANNGTHFLSKYRGTLGLVAGLVGGIASCCLYAMRNASSKPRNKSFYEQLNDAMTTGTIRVLLPTRIFEALQQQLSSGSHAMNSSSPTRECPLTVQYSNNDGWHTICTEMPAAADPIN